MGRLRMIGAVVILINNCPLFGQSKDGRPSAAIAQGRPDLRGLWAAYGNPNVAVAHFNISQSGEGFSMNRLAAGIPPVLIFEGAFKSDRLISGKAIDVGPAAG